jgi:hypothetical protein
VKGVQSNVRAIEELLEETKERQLSEQRKQQEMELQLQLQRQISSQNQLMDCIQVEERSYKSNSPFGTKRGATRRSRSVVPQQQVMQQAPPPPHAPQAQAQAQAQGQAQPSLPQQPGQAQQASQEPTKEVSPVEQSLGEGKGEGEGEGEAVLDDYTKLPEVLDKRFEALDEDNCLKATIIKPGNAWVKKSQASLLATPTTTHLGAKEQEEERKKAFDLLDALSRSGCLDFANAELHVVIASTHCFDKVFLLLYEQKDNSTFASCLASAGVLSWSRLSLFQISIF